MGIFPILLQTMNTAALAGIFRALAGPLVAAFSLIGIDISWLVDEQVAGLVIGLICAILSVRAKMKTGAPAVPLDTPPDHPNP